MKTAAAFACAVWMSLPAVHAQDKPAAPATDKPAAPATDKPATPAAPAKPALKITPGKVIIPTDRMRRIWGELIEIDPKTRTGSFRRDGTEEIFKFTILPYAELLHHAALGDVQDYRVGERAIFRLHENEQGEWVWLTYIQDEMNFLNGHKEYYHVDKIDAANNLLECTDANADKSYVRKTGIPIGVDAETRYWKAGQPAKFTDIRVGDKLRTKTRGTGQGEARVCWEVFLDDESLLKFQSEQKAVHTARLRAEGLPGYVDALDEGVLEITLFPEGRELFGKLKAGQTIRVAPAGVDRKPSQEPISAVVTAIKTQKLTLTVPATAAGFTPTGLVRVFAAE